MHEVPGVDLTALHFYLAKDDGFCFVTYQFISYLYGQISSARLCRTSVDRWDVVGISWVWRETFLWVFVWLPHTVSDTCLVTRPSTRTLAVLHVDENSTVLSFGPLHRPPSVQTPATLLGLKDHQFLFSWKIQPTKAVTGRTMPLR